MLAKFQSDMSKRNLVSIANYYAICVLNAYFCATIQSYLIGRSSWYSIFFSLQHQFLLFFVFRVVFFFSFLNFDLHCRCLHNRNHNVLFFCSAGLFTVALLWERINEAGAFWGLTSAFIIGLIRMVLDFIYPSLVCGEEDHRPYAIKHLLIHYMYFALFLYLWTMLIVIIISLFTKPIPKKYVSLSVFILQPISTTKPPVLKIITLGCRPLMF